jgi:hypothetical protein
MSRPQRPFACLAALLAGTYLVLAVFSMACAVEHFELQTAGHHHGSTVSHSGFCAWACQVNPTSAIGSSTLVLHPFLAAAPFVQSGHVVIASVSGFHASSRAPPVLS